MVPTKGLNGASKAVGWESVAARGAFKRDGRAFKRVKGSYEIAGRASEVAGRASETTSAYPALLALGTSILPYLRPSNLCVALSTSQNAFTLLQIHLQCYKRIYSVASEFATPRMHLQHPKCSIQGLTSCKLQSANCKIRNVSAMPNAISRNY